MKIYTKDELLRDNLASFSYGPLPGLNPDLTRRLDQIKKEKLGRRRMSHALISKILGEDRKSVV